MLTTMLSLSLCVLSILSLASAVPAYNNLKQNDVIVQINSTTGPITQLFTLRIIETDPEKRRSAIDADSDDDDNYDGEEQLALGNPITNTETNYELANSKNREKGLKFGRAIGIGMGLDYIAYAYRPFMQPRRLYDARIVYAGPSDVLCTILHYNEAVNTGEMRMYGSHFTIEDSLDIGNEPLNFAGGILCVAPGFKLGYSLTNS